MECFERVRVWESPGVALWRRLGEIRNGPSRRGDTSERTNLNWSSRECTNPDQIGLGNDCEIANRPRSYRISE